MARDGSTASGPTAIHEMPRPQPLQTVTRDLLAHDAAQRQTGNIRKHEEFGPEKTGLPAKELHLHRNRKKSIFVSASRRAGDIPTRPTQNRTDMADNYLERKMEEYRARPLAAQRPPWTLDRLLLRNRSCRGYDSRYIVREDQLLTLIGANARIASARNRQALRFRPVLADEAPKLLPHVHMGAALPELHLPLPGTEPNAFIVVCSTVPADPDLWIDLGISVQTMLLRATEMGLNGLCIRAFNRQRTAEALGLELEPLAVVAIGRSIERYELESIGADGERAYRRREDGVHLIPKVRPEELVIPRRDSGSAKPSSDPAEAAPNGGL